MLFAEPAYCVVNSPVPTRTGQDCGRVLLAKPPCLGNSLGVGVRCPDPIPWEFQSLQVDYSDLDRREKRTPEVTNPALPGPEVYFWGHVSAWATAD